MARSTSMEFGRKLSAALQTNEALPNTAFGRQIFDGQISLDPQVALVNPMANHTRPLHTRKGLKTSEVTFKEALVRSATAIIPPAFFDLLRASGMTQTIGASSVTLTLPGIPSNDVDLVCETFDGIQKVSAWGVRGSAEIVGEKPGDRIMCAFNGKGHGTADDQAAWPNNVVDDNGQSALFEGNEILLGDFAAEARRCSFKIEGDPVMLESGISDDGFLEPYLADKQAFLRLDVYEHATIDRDWLGALEDVVSNDHACSWTIPMGGGFELVIAGNFAIVKFPNRTNNGGVGTFPLELQALRTAPVTITYQTAA